MKCNLPIICVAATGFENWTSRCVLKIEFVNAKASDVEFMGIGCTSGRRQLGPGVHSGVACAINSQSPWNDKKLNCLEFVSFDF